MPVPSPADVQRLVDAARAVVGVDSRDHDMFTLLNEYEARHAELTAALAAFRSVAGGE
jgi:hypothetical protein